MGAIERVNRILFRIQEKCMSVRCTDNVLLAKEMKRTCEHYHV